MSVQGVLNSYILRTKENKKYLNYLMQCEGYHAAVGELARGTTMLRISRSNLGNIHLPIPPRTEQDTIVKYLDKYCNAIDSSISRHKQIIEKLEEYRKSVITQAVTKGLNPDAEMKDSTILWVGQIPKTWNTVRIKNTSWLKGRIGWDGLKAKEFTDEGPYLITGTDFENGKINWNTCAHITPERYEEDELLHIKEGDLLITKDGTIGKLAIVENCPPEVSLNSGVMIIRNNSSTKYDTKFLYYVLLSDEFWSWFHINQKPNSTIQHLYQHQFGEFRYAYPPLSEQVQIVTALDKMTASITFSISQHRQLIEKLQEYKQSLIYNAVTGKIDCRAAE